MCSRSTSRTMITENLTSVCNIPCGPLYSRIGSIPVSGVFPYRAIVPPGPGGPLRSGRDVLDQLDEPDPLLVRPAERGDVQGRHARLLHGPHPVPHEALAADERHLL